MQKFLDGIKDFLYDSVDYIIMIAIIGLVIFIIGWRLDLLFAKDAEDIIPNDNIIVETEQDKDKTHDPSEEDGKENEEGPTKDNSNSTTITVSIPAGSTLSNISDILESNGLISSKPDFISKSEDMKLATKVKAGNFKIETGSSLEDILNILTK